MIGKVRLGCDVGEGVGRSQSVIVVRDDLGVLEIFANQFESKAETAHAICGLAQKWQIGLEVTLGPSTFPRYERVGRPFRARVSGVDLVDNLLWKASGSASILGLSGVSS